MIKRVSVVLLTFCMAAAPCWAQPAADHPNPVSWGGELTLSSAYLWRGNVDLPGPTLQPAFWVGFGDLSVTSWTALDTGHIHEHDLTLAFERRLANVAVNGGWINYFLPGGETRHENEMFAGVAYVGAVTPSFTVWHGLGSSTAHYLEAALSTRIPWHRVALEPRFAAAYDRNAAPSPTISHIESTVAIAWEQHGYAISPYVSSIINLRAGGEHHMAGGLLLVIGE